MNTPVCLYYSIRSLLTSQIFLPLIWDFIPVKLKFLKLGGFLREPFNDFYFPFLQPWLSRYCCALWVIVVLECEISLYFQLLRQRTGFGAPPPFKSGLAPDAVQPLASPDQNRFSHMAWGDYILSSSFFWHDLFYLFIFCKKQLRSCHLHPRVEQNTGNGGHM